jgi:hypothetical protein
LLLGEFGESGLNANRQRQGLIDDPGSDSFWRRGAYSAFGGNLEELYKINILQRVTQ